MQLSLGVLTTTVFGLECLADGIQAIRAEGDLAIVFGIVMQCQIIDDVVDYSKDAAAGLPSFLTAPESLQEAFELTCKAARGYANDQGLPRSGDVLPLRLALFAVSSVAKILIILGRWRQAANFEEPPVCGGEVGRATVTRTTLAQTSQAKFPPRFQQRLSPLFSQPSA